MTASVLLDVAGRRRSPATLPGYHAGRVPPNKGQSYPADPPTVEEIVAVMRQAPESRRDYRVRAMIVVLWRAGLRVQEALALIETVAHGDQSGRAQCLCGEREDHREGGPSPTEGGDAVVALSRDPATGALTQLPGEEGCVSEDGADGCAQGPGLGSANAVAVSPDGRNVYVTSGAGVAVFARDGDGKLTQPPGSAGCVSEGTEADCGRVRAIAGADDLAVSPDGQQVYVAANAANAVAVLTRDPASGSLSQSAGSAGCIGAARACALGRALARPEHLALSNDGRSVYSAGNFAYTGAIVM